jgi:hypothetical protein
MAPKPNCALSLASALAAEKPFRVVPCSWQATPAPGLEGYDLLTTNPWLWLAASV